MTKTKSTKRALLMSAFALLMCVSMLIGSTYAWFTDSVTSGNNKIVAGNLDVNLYYWDMSMGAGADFISLADNPNTKLFKNVDGEEILWEPNASGFGQFTVANEGTLALKYELKLDFYNATATPDGKTLADVLTVYAIARRGNTGADNKMEDANLENLRTNGMDSLIAGYEDVALKDFVLTSYLLPGESFTYELGINWNQSDNDNDFNVPGGLSMDCGVTLLATQMTYEKDSYDDQYDKDAEYPQLPDVWDGTADTSWYNDTDTEFELNTAEQLAGLAKLVDDGNTFEDKTVKLGNDVDLASLPFNPIGHSSNGKSFNGTFDGQGYTISNMYEQNDLGAWQYEGEYYGLFAYTNGATIKNVTIADAYISSGRNEAAGVVGNAVDTVFSDITISNTTLIAYNNSAGGVAAECYGDCSFTNIVVDEDTVIGPLWGTYDVRLGGVVGMVKSSDKVSFSNITVACQLDAINDVAANYQYWLYRYSGMLIGQVDGVNGVADPTGYVTCENVTVIYGDWVNYHYCEDADLGAGSYNGPGEYKYARVEAGTGTDGIDLSACNHNEDESHNVLIVFDQLFGGGQGVSGLKTYDGVAVVYPNN